MFFQAEDKDGNVIATNSISIYKIGKLTPDKFNVNINFNKGMGLHSSVSVIPSLELVNSPYYDIYYKTSFEGEVSSVIGPHTSEYTQIANNSELYFYTMVASDFSIYFEVRNRETGEVSVTKSYDIHLDMNSGNVDFGENNNGSITGGIINEGTDDEEVITPENDSNLTSYAELTESSSLRDIIEAAKGSFVTFQYAFSILPGFIWAFIAVTLTVIIALRILGR